MAIAMARLGELDDGDALIVRLRDFEVRRR
jgi:hypothetical protein